MTTFKFTLATVTLALACACGGGGAEKAPDKDKKAAKDSKSKVAKVDLSKGKDKDAKAPDAKAPDAKAPEAAPPKPVEITADPGTADWFVQGFGAFRTGNLDPIVSNFADDIDWEAVGSPLAPPSKGKEAVLARWEGLLTGIPDMKLTANRIFHQGDLVAIQCVLTGKHTGDFRGLPPTNKDVGANVLAIVRHNDKGQAKDVKVFYNEAALLAQMGVLEGAPAPAIPEIPSGDPEVVQAEADAKAADHIKGWWAAVGKDAYKDCEEKFCAEGYVHSEMATGAIQKTPEEHKAAMEGFFGAFPDMKMKSSEIVAFGGDWVVAWGSGKGTHKGPMGPIEATKKKVNLGYAEVFKLEGGKIKESWGYSNGLDMLAQIGKFEAPSPKVAKK